MGREGGGGVMHGSKMKECKVVCQLPARPLVLETVRLVTPQTNQNHRSTNQVSFALLCRQSNQVRTELWRSYAASFLFHCVVFIQKKLLLLRRYPPFCRSLELERRKCDKVIQIFSVPRTQCGTPVRVFFSQ